jgi:hypothetical protein
MDHIDMAPATKDQPTNWWQLATVLLVILIGWGVLDSPKYVDEVTAERDGLRQKVKALNEDLNFERARRGIACTDVAQRYSMAAVPEVNDAKN